MRKMLILMFLALCCANAQAQLNLQLHYDLGKTIYGDELSARPHLTATLENFTPDKWGSTYFFIDANLADNKMESAYAEIARELKFWKAPVAVHIEYNGGLADGGSYNDAYLLGGAYNWASKDFKKTFSVQALYRYLANQTVGTRHSWQLTTVWGINFAKGMFDFSGYTDLAHDNSVDGALVFTSEPQLWFNLNALKCVSDDMKLSVGTELEISNNFVWPSDGKNNRFYVIPTIAAKWTF